MFRLLRCVHWVLEILVIVGVVATFFTNTFMGIAMAVLWARVMVSGRFGPCPITESEKILEAADGTNR